MRNELNHTRSVTGAPDPGGSESDRGHSVPDLGGSGPQAVDLGAAADSPDAAEVGGTAPDAAGPIPTQVNGAHPRSPSDGGSEADGEIAERVHDLVAGLLKAARSSQMYVPGNPMIAKFRTEAAGRFAAVWEELPDLVLEVDESRLVWNGHDVYSEPIGPENLAFHFFKDGIRGLRFLPGVEETELDEFLDLIHLGRAGKEAEDTLALLWHRDFDYLQFHYSERSPEEEGMEVPTPDRNAGAGERVEDRSEIEEALETAAEGGPLPSDEEAELATLYLSDADQAYLRRELEGEWQRSLKRDITLALLDQFEMRDEDRRRQVVDILREFLPRLLAERDFSNVALILNELQLLANKTGEAETQELVTSLLRDMSEAVAEMVSTAADDGGAAARSGEITSLLSALQAEAIPTLVRAIPAVSNVKLRRQLAESLDRLVATDPSQILPLLRADDPVLAGEAARIIGRLRIRDAEAELLALATRPEESARQAAIEALAELGARDAAAGLVSALDDESRDVRLAAARALAELRPSGAAEALEERITGSALGDRDPPEQMAFFKAYAAVAGEGGVPTLDRLLNGRRWWGGRQPSTIRASAARALGLVPGEAAGAALTKADEDRDAQVRSAVRISRRALEGRRAEETEGAA